MNEQPPVAAETTVVQPPVDAVTFGRPKAPGTASGGSEAVQVDEGAPSSTSVSGRPKAPGTAPDVSTGLQIELQPLTLTWKRSEAIGLLALAMSKAQRTITGAAKDSDNPFHKSKYSSLAAVWEACRESLSVNEIAVFQPVSSLGRRVAITTLLVHSSEQWIEATLELTAAVDTPQGIGSAITYGQRYSLRAMVGVPPQDDDDGAAGSRTLAEGVRHDTGGRRKEGWTGVAETQPQPPADYVAATAGVTEGTRGSLTLDGGHGQPGGQPAQAPTARQARPRARAGAVAELAPTAAASPSTPATPVVAGAPTPIAVMPPPPAPRRPARAPSAGAPIAPVVQSTSE